MSDYATEKAAVLAKRAAFQEAAMFGYLGRVDPTRLIPEWIKGQSVARYPLPKREPKVITGLHYDFSVIDGIASCRSRGDMIWIPTSIDLATMRALVEDADAQERDNA